MRGDGLKPLLQFRIAVDAAVIAGMGPRSIQQILQHDEMQMISTFIVQPMQGLFLLRRFLLQNSWSIMDADLVEEQGRLYGMWMIRRSPQTGVDPRWLWFPKEFQSSAWFTRLVAERLAYLQRNLQYWNVNSPEYYNWQREREHLTGVTR